MSSVVTRRTLLRLAGALSLSAAAAAAARAEGQAPGAAASFALTTPMHIGEATLRVRDLPLMRDFYRDAIGLAVLTETADAVTLGVDGKRLLTLELHAGATTEPRSAAGLYHVAYLMPSRADLARWLVHVAISKVPLTGFADHRVSEAVYLDDPEGNGIEVYSDRPESGWLWVAGRVAMGSEPLDIEDLFTLTDTSRDTYAGAPSGTAIGHIHLRAGDIAQATAFYGTAMGLDVTAGRADAVFLSSGQYHHHLALNTWESAGAGTRQASTTGLARFSLAVADRALLDARVAQLQAAGHPVTVRDDGAVIADPWGTEVHLVA